MRRVMSLLCSAAALALGFSVSSLARAESCAPGDWFCDPASAPAPPPPSEPPPAEPPEDEAPRGDGSFRGPRDRRLELDEPRFPPPRFRRRHPFPRWGASVHVFGALLGNGSGMSREASMGGLGLGLRHFFAPAFALDGNVEFGFGTDYNGFDRQETAFLLHAVGVLNPRSTVRAYILGGFGFSVAAVSGLPSSVNYAEYPSRYDNRYSYVGMDLGAGVEVRVTRHAAIHVDLLGFVRDRTDDGPNSRPEFMDVKTGRTTNTSGGALLRVGTQFYW
jgi:hypothetical protein